MSSYLARFGIFAYASSIPCVYAEVKRFYLKNERALRADLGGCVALCGEMRRGVVVPPLGTGGRGCATTMRLGAGRRTRTSNLLGLQLWLARVQLTS